MKSSAYLLAASAIVASVVVTVVLRPSLGSYWAADSTKSDDVLPNSIVKQSAASYVGSSTCKSCHAVEFNLWQDSDHFKAMQEADSSAVLGNFDNVRVEFNGIETLFSKSGDEFLIETQGANQDSKTYSVRNTFGHWPLQQYLIELENGRIQAFDVAWDSRLASEEGQRWFHLQPNEPVSSEHPFFWTKHFQNWNSRCADCHSTNLKTNYNVDKNAFETTFSEINVACEACHGPASNHLAVIEQGMDLQKGSGFDLKAEPKLKWQFVDDSAIAKPSGNSSEVEINQCGQCHSLRTPLVGAHAEKVDEDYHNRYRLQLINEASYFADGQIKEEAFVIGSFLQSKMYHKGVRCSNCHEPHSGEVKTPGNALCAQCHKPSEYDRIEHHHHEPESEGAQCINCHMPSRAFMVVDDRRDHSFPIPRPQLSLDLGVPNACLDCHQDQDNEWLVKITESWNLKSSNDHWAYLMRRGTQNDVLVTRAISEAVLNTSLPALVRASLLQHLAPIPSRVSAELATKSLYDKNPLVRRAAVASFQSQPLELRWQTLEAFFEDESRSVRIQIAEVLQSDWSAMDESQQIKLAPLLEEYEASLNVSASGVASQLNLANLYFNKGDLVQAESAYLAAIKIESAYVPALLSLAEFYRRTGRDENELRYLQNAVEAASDSGAAQHSLGLYFVRQKQYEQAMPYLKQATSSIDASAYYSYVYAVALENRGQLSKAIEALESADKRWPNQYEILLTLVLYLEKSQQRNRALEYLSKLSAIAPGAPAVQQLVQRLGAS